MRGPTGISRVASLAVVVFAALALHPMPVLAQVDGRGPADPVEFDEFLDGFIEAEMARLAVRA